eukprot:SAG11_NODE_174_length_13505_cov_9.126585_6_plen_168_part_00
MVGDLVPNEREDGAAGLQRGGSLWGMMSFVDKTSNGTVILLVQLLVPPSCRADERDGSCEFFRQVPHTFLHASYRIIPLPSSRSPMCSLQTIILLALNSFISTSPRPAYGAMLTCHTDLALRVHAKVVVRVPAAVAMLGGVALLARRSLEFRESSTRAMSDFHARQR